MHQQGKPRPLTLPEELYTQILSFQRSSKAAGFRPAQSDAKSRNENAPVAASTQPLLTQASTNNPYFNVSDSKTKTKDSESASQRSHADQSLRYD